MFALIEEVHKYLHGGKLSPDMLMVESDVMKLEEYANKITGLIHDKDDVEAWVISKIAKAEQTIANVKHTLEVTYPKRFAHGGEVIKHDGEIIHMMLHHIGKYATKMLVAIRSGKIHIDEWMKHELAIAGSDIDSVYHYLDTFHKQKKEAGGNMDMEEDYFEADEYADGGKIGKAKLEKPYYVVGRKKHEQLVDINELPMTKFDCERFVKEQGVEKHYADVAIIPYHGKKPINRYAKNRYADGGAVGKYKVGDEVEEEGLYPNISKYKNYASVSELNGKKVYNSRLELYGYINDDDIANWGKIASEIFVVKEKGSDKGHYWDKEDVCIVDDDKFAKGGKIGKAKLEKELHKLIRELNSRRLQTYMEGDTSDEENARQKERSTKMARYYEVLELLNNYADGGAVVYVPNHATPSQRKKIAKVMHEFKHRQLKSHDHVVTDIKQAMAIAMSEAGLSYEKHAKSDTEYSFGGDLLNKAKHITHAGYNKAHELVSKHIHKEHHKAKKYELGDMWSEDFDYDGLLEAASKIGASMSLSDVEMIFRSMEDVNYHRLAKLLDTYIKARKKTDNHKKRADSLNYFRKMLKKFNEEYKKGGKVIEAGRWVVYNPETNEIIKNVGSHVTAKKEMYKLWDTEKYNELGIMSYRRWSQENVFCEGGGVGHYEDGGGIISSFRLPASDTTPVGLGGIPNYNTPLDEWALHYDKGGSLYKSPSEYKEELEVKSDEEIARLYSEEFGLNIDDVLEDIEDERDEYIRELVHIYKTVLKSKGEI